jgi:hypothetical protein
LTFKVRRQLLSAFWSGLQGLALFARKVASAMAEASVRCNVKGVNAHEIVPMHASHFSRLNFPANIHYSVDIGSIQPGTRHYILME